MSPSNAVVDAHATRPSRALQEHDVAAAMPPPKISLDSFSNALVLLPPPSIQARVNALRCANDKSHPRWTAHLTLVFPFVGADNLPSVLAHLRSDFARAHLQPFPIRIDTVGRFRQREYETVYLGASQYMGATGAPPSRNEGLHLLWTLLANGVGYRGRPFVPHMTLGQTSHRVEDIQLLESKARRLLAVGSLEWIVDRVVVLQKDEKDGGKMKIVDELPFDVSIPRERWTIAPDTQSTYHFDSAADSWIAGSVTSLSNPYVSQFAVTTFNVLHTPQNDCITRFESIRTLLLDAGGDVLCLQEVTDEFLDLLLQDRDIRAKWTWCTRAPGSPMESERNVVVFSSDHLPFTWNRVSLGGKHKAASVLSLKVSRSRPEGEDNDNDDPITICLAAVHLTAGLTAQHLETKSREFATLLSYLQLHHPEDEWLIAGDTNFPSHFRPNIPSTIPSEVVDVWLSIHGESGSGDFISADLHDATYDPTQNPLALATSRADKTPQRYDRVYLKSSGGLICTSVDVLHSQPSSRIASDHWPVRASFVVAPKNSMDGGVRDLGSPAHEARGTDNGNPSSTAATFSDASPKDSSSGPDADLLEFLRASNAVPGLEHKHRSEEVMQTLRRIIGASEDGETQRVPSETVDIPDVNDGPMHTARSAVKLVLVLVGSVAMGVDLPNSDLDCFVVGNISPVTFWELVKERIVSYNKAVIHAQTSESKVSLRRFVKGAAVQMMVLEIDGKKIDLQYCPAAELAERWDTSEDLSLNSNITLSAPSMRVLNAHRDRQRLQRVIPSVTAFQNAYRFIKLLCLRRGLYAARFGYLGGIHISILLTRIAELQPNITSAAELVEKFFDVYCAFDWKNAIASVANVDTSYSRSQREPLVILSPLKPVVNVAANASVATAQTVQDEFRIVDTLLKRGASWTDVCSDERLSITAFLGSYEQFIKLDLNYWGDDCMAARALIGYVESRIVRLLVDLHTIDPKATFRLWPERFTDSQSANEVKTSTVQGFYLIGVRQLSGEGESSDTKSLARALHGFEDAIHGNSNYYDSTIAHVALHELGKAALPENVYVDEIAWSDDCIDINPDEPAAVVDDDGTAGATEDHDLHDRSPASQKQLTSVESPGKAKLRTSIDVFNRLLWDTQYDANDFLIGYTDRFLGIMEIPVKSWSRDIDDESWIPFHRIVYFRCKSSGEIVWDRQKRIDRMFGSGVQSVVGSS